MTSRLPGERVGAARMRRAPTVSSRGTRNLVTQSYPHADRRDSSPRLEMTQGALRALTRGGARFVSIPRQLAERLYCRLIDALPELLNGLFGGGFGAARIAVVEMGGPLAADVDVFHLVGPV